MPWHRTNKVKPKPISVAFMFMLESASSEIYDGSSYENKSAGA